MTSLKFLKSIFDNIRDNVLLLNINGGILYANTAACTLFGYDNHELCTNDLTFLLPPTDWGWCHEYIAGLHKLNDTDYIVESNKQLNLVKKNGVVFRANLRINCLNCNHVLTYTAYFVDSSQNNESEKRLQKYTFGLNTESEKRTMGLVNEVKLLAQAKEDVNNSLQKEKEVNRLKTRFFSMAAHELKTPISSIQLSVSLIERYYDGMQKENVLAHLNKIKTAAANLTSTVNDFLSVEKIETGVVILVNKNFNFKSFCENIITELNLQLKPGQTILYHHHSDQAVARLDDHLLRHILVNLLTNAIKYSGNTGIIELDTNIETGRYTITVKDHGIGIPKDEQSNLFRTFFRASNTQSIEGTGLGLYIVKRYVTIMNGEISFESNKEYGTAFTIVFPVPVD